MQGSVLNLGEKIVLASRLAAIEHVRQIMTERGQIDQRMHDPRFGSGGAASDGGTDAAGSRATCAFIASRWSEFFRSAERSAA